MNNAFIAKKDYFGLADTTNLVCKSSDEGKSNELAEATGQDGSIVAHNVYGDKIAPSNEYVMKAVTLTKGDGDIALGQISTVDDKSICLNQLTIGTSAGSAPTINASGEQVEDSSTENCTYSIPAFSVSKKHHAQVLFNAFTFGGAGVHLKDASYTIGCSITKAEKEGVCLTHDVSEGKIECAVEFIQTGSEEPTLSAGTGWEVTAVPTCSNPDADWPSWSATLTKYLAKNEQ